MSIFEIDPDIRKAKTLSSEFYTCPEYFEMSKERIFARTWQFIGDGGGIETLRPVNILEGFLDEPILLTRNDGKVNCLSNVCTHRGNILVDEACSANLIRCGYHGRRFDLNGQFLSMPEFDGVENFPGESDNLPQVPFAHWGQFLFAAIDPVSPFEDFIAEAAALIDIRSFEKAKLVTTREYDVEAHWALYCENYLEGFHIPFVHQSLNAVIDYGSYSTDTFRYSSLQTALSEPPAAAGGLTRPSESKPNSVAARYLFIFPNLMFNFYPWGISVNVVRPVAPGKTSVEFLTYVSDESKLEKGAGSGLDRVEMEDEAIVESVQKGIRSRFYMRGRYSPTREQGTHHFHRLIAEFIN